MREKRVCRSCGRTFPRLRYKDLCDSCYMRRWRARKRGLAARVAMFFRSFWG
jgi:NMD protein affecting ribosome stability and mRNA decay